MVALGRGGVSHERGTPVQGLLLMSEAPLHAPTSWQRYMYRGTSLMTKRTPLGPYRRPVPRVLGGWAFSYGRGTPVHVALPGSGGVKGHLAHEEPPLYRGTSPITGAPFYLAGFCRDPLHRGA